VDFIDTSADAIGKPVDNILFTPAHILDALDSKPTPT
jgi:hypothetical protein